MGNFYAMAKLAPTIGYRRIEIERLYLSSLVRLKVLYFEKKPLSYYIGNLTTGQG